MNITPKTPPVIDWDQALDNLRKIFRDMENQDRRERDRARRQLKGVTPTSTTKAPPRRCESCKRFCKDRFCAKCQE